MWNAFGPKLFTVKSGKHFQVKKIEILHIKAGNIQQWKTLLLRIQSLISIFIFVVYRLMLICCFFSFPWNYVALLIKWSHTIIRIEKTHHIHYVYIYWITPCKIKIYIYIIIISYHECQFFCHEWGDLAMMFMTDEATSENHCQITSWVTKNRYSR